MNHFMVHIFKLISTAMLIGLIHLTFTDPASAQCNLGIDPPKDIVADTFYVDNRGSIIDQDIVAKNTRSLGKLDEAIYQVVLSVNIFYLDNSKPSAKCAAKQLAIFAESKAMLGVVDARQAKVERLWRTTGLAIDYYNIRNLADESDQQQIDLWISELGRRVTGDFEAIDNNGRAWVALMNLAIGLSTRQPMVIDQARKYFSDVTNQVDSQGLLPKELARGRKALHYHNFALAPLVEILALAKYSKIDIEDTQKQAVYRVAEAVCKAIAAPQAEMLLADNQDKIQPNELVWLAFAQLSDVPHQDCPSIAGHYKNPALGGDLSALALFWNSSISN